MDTSAPRQRDASDSALVDMLMLEAPVGLALFGPDLRFRWVNAALTRFSADAGVPGPDPSGCQGLLPSQAWPPDVAARAENALRKVLDEGAPLSGHGSIHAHDEHPCTAPGAAMGGSFPGIIVPAANQLSVPQSGN